VSAVFRRILAALPVLWGVATLSFLLIHLVPGDPVDIILGEQAAAVDKAALRTSLGLDEPLLAQYRHYLVRLIHFDLGRSLMNKHPVAQELKERIPATFELTACALLLSIFIGLPVGVLCSIYRRRWIAEAISALTLIGISIPSFWLAPMLIWLIALRLDLLPISERGGISHLVLPTLSLAFGLIAVLIQVTKASMLDVLNEDYIRVARAKGLHPVMLFGKHALKNAAIPLVTTIGLQFGALLTGAVIIETVFDWPGLGSLLFQGLQQRNYPVVQGCVLTMAVIYVLVTLATDLIYTAFDPRMRLN
jgi:ABC-type dipeptide/oligopeptide/nickel transport system permease component